MSRLDGKIALITGAASGFGAATGKVFAREGAKVVLTDRNEGGVQAVAREIGNAATALAHDVRLEDDWKRVVDETLSMHGRLDILMNNAGVMGTGAAQDIEHMSLDEWKFVNEVNSDGVFLGCRAVIQAMKESGGGSIVNIASVAGLMAMPLQSVYAMTKAAVVSMTRTLSVELGPDIRLNAVCPGLIDTRFASALTQNDEILQTVMQKTSLKRVGQPQDVAGAALLLASDAGGYFTGSVLTVDGGWSLG